MQVEREKQQILSTLADLDARITQQEQATINLRSLYEYCRDVERELAAFDFADKRLALEALGAEMVAAGRNWRLNANLPFDDVELRKSCSEPSRNNTLRLTLAHHAAYDAALGAGAG